MTANKNCINSGTLGGKILGIAQSICPLCHKSIEAFYIVQNRRVYFTKECSEHGVFKSLISESEEDYTKWTRRSVINVPPKKALTKGDPDDNECPLHCGTCTNHLQTACCVLIDITDRCNQHCPYCFAKAEPDADRSGEPSLREIDAKLDLLMDLGEERPFNLQLSGGEPTVRDDLPEIIEMAARKGFEYIQINSNGRRLAEEPGYADKLKKAGASVIFMQFDGTRDDIYEKLRGEPLFEIKKQAIRNCEKAGLAVTLVPTVVAGVNTDNLGEMMDFLMENVNVIKGIHFQPVSFFGRHPETNEDGEFAGRVTMFGLMRELEKQRPHFRYDDMCPISTGHTLCCFYSTYIKEPDGSAKCTLSSRSKMMGIGCECEISPGNLEIIRKDRDFVLNKWDVGDPQAHSYSSSYRSSTDIMDMDEFLKYNKQNTFTVTGMAFQDIMNIDSERVKRCRVQVLSEDNRLIPFCAYNTIYRK